MVTIDKMIVNYQFTRDEDTHQIRPLTGLTQHISIYDKIYINHLFTLRI